MQRRSFLGKTLKTSAALCVLPYLSFADEGISNDELIGKGDPDLKGKHRLRKAAANAFDAMSQAALSDGFSIKVVSSYRSYDAQNRIWERKYQQFTSEGLSPTAAIEKIVEYSTIPGTSRHHWGTDLDVVPENTLQLEDELLEEHFNPGGPFHSFKLWLDKRANSFGFYEVYTPDPNRKGFKYEPWHFSYKPLSKKYLKAYQKIDIAQILRSSLMGGQHFTDAFINQYIEQNILDINPELK